MFAHKFSAGPVASRDCTALIPLPDAAYSSLIHAAPRMIDDEEFRLITFRDETCWREPKVWIVLQLIVWEDHPKTFAYKIANQKGYIRIAR